MSAAPLADSPPATRERKFLRLGDNGGLGADDHQWILYRGDSPVSFVRSTKAVLVRCIREKGYASTSLTDIAIRAQMSPSHIRYYFDGKDAILEYYLETTCADIIRDIRAIDGADFSISDIQDPGIDLLQCAERRVRPRLDRGEICRFCLA